MDDFKVDFAFLEYRHAVGRQSHTENLLVIPVCAVVTERRLFCVALMLRGDPRREAPSHIHNAIAQGDIVDVVYLEKSVGSLHEEQEWGHTLNTSSNLGFMCILHISFK